MRGSDPKLGVALTKCWFCGEGDKILMNTRLTAQHAAKVEGAHGKVIDMDPCAKCSDLMKQGVMLIVMDESKSGTDWNKGPMPNPYRTGSMHVVRDEAVSRIFDPEHAAWAIKHRWMLIDVVAATAVGLPAK